MVRENYWTVFADDKLFAWLNNYQFSDYDLGFEFFLLSQRLETDGEFFVLFDQLIGREADRL